MKLLFVLDDNLGEGEVVDEVDPVTDEDFDGFSRTVVSMCSGNLSGSSFTAPPLDMIVVLLQSSCVRCSSRSTTGGGLVN